MASSQRSPGLPDQIAERLQRAIQRGQFKPQDPLPSERVLAERWKTSRPIIREGIAMLVAKGLLTRRHGLGTYVNEAEGEDAPGTRIWAELSRRHDNLQGDLFEFREVMECAAAELAARRHDATDRRRLQQAGAAVDLAWAAGDRKEQLRTDIAFHQSISEATHNQVFIHLMATLHRLLLDQMQLSQAGMEQQSGESDQVRRQHQQLLDAILARDSAAASGAASSHLEYVRVQLNQMQPQPADRRRR